jgi:hypothetical protein
MDGKYNTGEALRVVNTRRRGIKDECNEKTRWILSQHKKQTVTVRQATYYGLFIYADEVMGMTIFDRVIQRRG